MKVYSLAVMIGRWQPFHNGHFANLKKALSQANHVLIIVGSANIAPTIKNPFTPRQRMEMIHSCLMDGMTDADLSDLGVTKEQLMDSVSFCEANDYMYEDTRWLSEIQDTIGKEYKALYPECNGLGLKNKIALVGHDKDESTYYMKMFPNYSVIDVGAYTEIGETPINATHVRDLIFERHLTSIKSLVPPPAFSIIKRIVTSQEFAHLYEEYACIKQYREQWSHTPYPVTFNTVDAVVVEGGHVLLIKRKYSPGKGLWALPGGFLNPRETSRQAVIRELKEETGLKVPTVILDKAITYQKRFDHPDRSLRGRTITEAFLIELSGSEDGRLPRVKGSDDAADAKFFQISDVMKMSDQLFEDHFSIISMMLTRAK